MIRHPGNRRRLLYISVYAIVGSLLYLKPTTSFTLVQRPDPHHGRPRHTSTTSTTTTKSAFLWFGGDEDKDSKKSGDAGTTNNNNDFAISSNLAGVANVMNSMQSFKTSQKVAERTGASLQDLANILVEGTSADGKVKVTFNGQKVPVSVQMDENYFKSLQQNKEGVDELCVALTQAMKEAHYKSSGKVDEKLKSLYNDLNFDT